MELRGCRRVNKPIFGLFSRHYYNKIVRLTPPPGTYTDREVVSMEWNWRRARDVLVVYLLNVALILLCQQL